MQDKPFICCIDCPKISIKFISDKNNFQIVIFAKQFVTKNEFTYKLFKNIYNDVHTKGKGKIHVNNA